MEDLTKHHVYYMMRACSYKDSCYYYYKAVGYLKGWPRIWNRSYREIIQVLVKSEERLIACPTPWLLCRAASGTEIAVISLCSYLYIHQQRLENTRKKQVNVTIHCLYARNSVNLLLFDQSQRYFTSVVEAQYELGASTHTRDNAVSN